MEKILTLSMNTRSLQKKRQLNFVYHEIERDSQKMEIASLIYDKRSVIVEFLQLDKETIWKDKYFQCDRSFHTIKSFLISLSHSLNGSFKALESKSWIHQRKEIL